VASGMYSILLEEVYFPSRNGHANLNMWGMYVGVLPKNGTKSQGYNSFTIAFWLCQK